MRGCLAVVLAGCVTLAGCAAFGGGAGQEPAPWVHAGMPQPASDTESLLLYFQRLKMLPGAELGREHETARQAYTRASTDFNRVRFAMVLSLPNSAFTDDSRALELLDSVAKDPGARLQGLAQLLRSNLQEQKKLSANVPQPASDTESLLLYFQNLRKLPGAELGREHETARQAYALARTDYNCVRFAMVLSLPNSAFTDDSRALELLDSVAKDPGAQLQGLAQLLSSNLQEQRKLNAGMQGLQQKLDALKSLDRSMIERSR